jgi:hypothetical protein
LAAASFPATTRTGAAAGRSGGSSAVACDPGSLAAAVAAVTAREGSPKTGTPMASKAFRTRPAEVMTRIRRRSGWAARSSHSTDGIGAKRRSSPPMA